MNPNTLPSLEEFLAAPIEEVAKVAPATLIFAAGGTRRSAALAGISTQSDDYVRWLRQRMIRCFDLIFRHGVSHIFTFAIVDSQTQEVTDIYRERLIQWVDWGVAGSEALADYQRLGWRARLLGGESLPPLQTAAERLLRATVRQSSHTLWWYVIPDPELPWKWLLTAAQHAGACTRQEAIEALYGENIPPATLFLSFGKPTINSMLLPPLLTGQVHCYWRQRPGYDLTEHELRTILYDYAHLRSTWRQDKTGRAEEALAHRDAWEHGPTIGLGIRMGPFWYPASIPPPRSATDEPGG